MLFSRKTSGEEQRVISLADVGRSSSETLESLQTLFDGKRKEDFVAKLFGGQVADFEQLIARLEGVASWSEAYHVIEEEFNRRGIPLHQKEAIVFTNLVYKRYFPKDRNVQIEE